MYNSDCKYEPVVSFWSLCMRFYCCQLRAVCMIAIWKTYQRSRAARERFFSNTFWVSIRYIRLCWIYESKYNWKYNSCLILSAVAATMLHRCNIFVIIWFVHHVHFLVCATSLDFLQSVTMKCTIQNGNFVLKDCTIGQRFAKIVMPNVRSVEIHARARGSTHAQVFDNTKNWHKHLLFWLLSSAHSISHILNAPRWQQQHTNRVHRFELHSCKIPKIYLLQCKTVCTQLLMYFVHHQHYRCYARRALQMRIWVLSTATGIYCQRASMETASIACNSKRHIDLVLLPRTNFIMVPKQTNKHSSAVQSKAEHGTQRNPI